MPFYYPLFIDESTCKSCNVELATSESQLHLFNEQEQPFHLELYTRRKMEIAGGPVKG